MINMLSLDSNTNKETRPLFNQHLKVYSQDQTLPLRIQCSDFGPGLSDRFSECSSSPVIESFHHATSKANGLKLDDKFGMKLSKHENRFEQSEIQNYEASSAGFKNDPAIVNAKSTSQCFGNNGKSKVAASRAKTTLQGSRETIVRRTQKIMKTYLKKQVPLIESMSEKAKQLRQIFVRVLTFVQVARVFKRSHSISPEQHRVIRDLASHRFEKSELKRIRQVGWYNFKEICWDCFDFLLSVFRLNRLLFPNGHILLPTDALNVYWMLFQLIFNFFTLYYASIYIVFDFRNRLLEIDNGLQPTSGIYTINVFVLIFTTFIDIIKGFNTAYYCKGETIIDRKSVAINYLQTRFVYDLLSLISVIMSRTFFPSLNPILLYRLQFLFFFKIHNIFHVISVFKSTFIQNEKYDNLIQLLRLLSILGLTSHINAICYHAQAQLQIYFMESTETWLSQADLVEANYWVRYINSFFCAAGTLVNAITYNPKTTIETVFMTISLLANCCIFGYVINELGNIMDNIERNSKKGKKELRLVNSFLQTKNVNRELQTRIRNYLEYMHREEKQLNLEETQVVIAKLSNQLRNELTKEVNSQYIKEFHILKTIFSRKVQETSLFIMHDHKYTPGEIIFTEGQMSEQNIYLVWEGSVDIYHTNQRQEDYLIQTISAKQCFGEISFFTGAGRAASARSKEFTSVISIERNEFIHLLKEHSHDDYEIFSQISHTIQQSQDYSLIYDKKTKQGKCFTCGSTNHLAKNCQLTHFIPQPIAVVMNAQRSFSHERVSSYNRKTTKDKWHSRNYLNLLKQDTAAQRIEDMYMSRIEELNEHMMIDLTESMLDQSQQIQYLQYTQQHLNSLERSATGGGFGSFIHEDGYQNTKPAGNINAKPDDSYRQNKQQQQQQQLLSLQQQQQQQQQEQLLKKQSKYSNAVATATGGVQNYAQFNHSATLIQEANGLVSPIVEVQDDIHGSGIFGNLVGNNGYNGPTLAATPSQYFIPITTGGGVSSIMAGQLSPQYSGTAQQLQIARLTSGLNRKNKRNGTLLTPGTGKVKSQGGGASSFLMMNGVQFGSSAAAAGGIPSMHNLAGVENNRLNVPNIRVATGSAIPTIIEENLGGGATGLIAANVTATHLLEHATTEQQRKLQAMRESFANLFEVFGKNVSLHIDFMRNFTKYFPKYNIEEISRNSIYGAKYVDPNVYLNHPHSSSNSNSKQTPNNTQPHSGNSNNANNQLRKLATLKKSQNQMIQTAKRKQQQQMQGTRMSIRSSIPILNDVNENKLPKSLMSSPNTLQ